MRGKLVLLTGFAAGYVLGAKAGTERYEEIRQQFNKLMGTEPAQQLQTQVRDVANRASEVVEQATTETINKAGEKAHGLVDTAEAKAPSGSGNSGTTDAGGTSGYAGSGGPAGASGSSGSTATAQKPKGSTSGVKTASKTGPDDDKSVTLP